MKPKMGEELKAIKYYYEHRDEMEKPVGEELNIIIHYLRYGEELGISNYKVFSKEFNYIVEYLENEHYQKMYTYQEFKKVILEKEKLEIETKNNLLKIKELFAIAKEQNNNLGDILDNINKLTHNLNMFHNSSDETITREEIENEDGTITYLFKNYLGGYYTNNGIELNSPEVSLKITVKDFSEITNIELIRLFALSPRGPRYTVRTTLKDVNSEECLISEDQYSESNYFKEKGNWINQSTEIINSQVKTYVK